MGSHPPVGGTHTEGVGPGAVSLAGGREELGQSLGCWELLFVGNQGGPGGKWGAGRSHAGGLSTHGWDLSPPLLLHPSGLPCRCPEAWALAARLGSFTQGGWTGRWNINKGRRKGN